MAGFVDARPAGLTSAVTASSVPRLYTACHRASAARRAISRRRLGLSFSALARPPFSPPSLPSAIACGFFRRVMVSEVAKRRPARLLNKIASFCHFADASRGAEVLDRVRNAPPAWLIAIFRRVAHGRRVGRTDTSSGGWHRSARSSAYQYRD